MRTFLFVFLLALSKVSFAGILVEVITADHVRLVHSSFAQKWLAAKGGQLSVYNLDSPRRMERSLSQGMEGLTEGQAEVVLKRRLASMTPEEKKRMASEVYMGTVLANRYKITRYPAILINRQAVIYGETDLKIALQRAFPTLWGE